MHTTMERGHSTTTDATGVEYLAFTLGAEEYAVNIQQVQEIRGYEKATHMANAPEYIKGLINLRGVIVPIVDLRIKLNIGTPSYNDTTVVIIANSNSRTIGFVVDSVTDVTLLAASDIKPVPDMGVSQVTEYVTGLGVVGERTLILADVDKLVQVDQVETIAA